MRRSKSKALATEAVEFDLTASPARLAQIAEEFSGPVVSYQYPRAILPMYRTVLGHRWTVRRKSPTLIRGYFKGMQVMQHPNWCLVEKRRGGNTVVWMSLTPLEIESHGPHIFAAHHYASKGGVVVIGGLGLGFYLHNVAINPTIRRVVVYEPNYGVIQTWRKATGGEAMYPFPDRIEIRNEPLPAKFDEPIDFFYADIWPNIADDNARPDMIRFVDGLGVEVRHCGYWCQEIDFVCDAQRDGVNPREFTREHVEGWIKATGLPLVGLERPEYPELVYAAGFNVAMLGVSAGMLRAQKEQS